MRAFIVFCLLAAVCADKLGYNYKPVGHSDSGLSFTPGFSSGSASGFVGSHGGGILSSSSLGNGNGFSSGPAPRFVGSTSTLGGGAGFGGTNGGFTGDFNGGVSRGTSGSFTHQPELEKEFYTYSANDNDFVEPAVENPVVSSTKRNLRVIFIKGPEYHGLENAALSLAKQAAEQRTAIYVFHKQADLNNLSNKLNLITSNINNKPEVHFVKYRTPEDAANAQKAIQSRYDSLGGITQNYDGGIAPVLNFASKTAYSPHDSFGPQGPIIGSQGFPTGTVGSFESNGSGGSFGPVGPAGSTGPVDSTVSVGSVGPSGISVPTTSYISPSSGGGASAVSPTYLPAQLKRRYRK